MDARAGFQGHVASAANSDPNYSATSSGTTSSTANTTTDPKSQVHAPLALSARFGGAQPSAVGQESDAYRSLNYTLQLSLSTANLTASEVALWSMQNPRHRATFEAHSRGLTSIHAWLDVSGYSDESIGQIFAQGMPAAFSRAMLPGYGGVEDQKKPLRFVFGALQAKDAYPKLQGCLQYLYCKVAIGRAYPVKADEPEDTPIPPGFDSNYLCGSSTIFPEVPKKPFAAPSNHERLNAKSPDGSRGGDDGTEADVRAVLGHSNADVGNFHHQYLIENPAQVLPFYLVRFMVSKTPLKNGRRMCQGCEDAPATLHCEKCEAVLCRKCDEEMHRLNKVLKKHQRHPLTAVSETQTLPQRLKAIKQNLGVARYDALSTCPIHAGKPVEFYDPVLNVPICVYCKMVGSHSSGDAVKHRLIGVEEGYKQALSESIKPDAALSERRLHIQRSTEYIAEVGAAVKENAAAVEKEIYRRLQIALRANAALAQHKLRILQSVEMDLLRQLFSLEWTEGYLKEQRDALPPAAFLKLWGQHAQLRDSTFGFGSAEAFRPPETLASRVKADITVSGMVTVTAGDMNVKYDRARGRPHPADDYPTSYASDRSRGVMESMLSPKTRKFMDVVLDEKTGSANGGAGLGQPIPRGVFSEEDQRLLDQAHALSMVNPADGRRESEVSRQLETFRQQVSAARNDAQRSIQRVASMPKIFGSVEAATKNSDMLNPHGSANDSSLALANSSRPEQWLVEAGVRGRRGSSMALALTEPPSSSTGDLAKMFEQSVQDNHRLSCISAQRAQDSPSLIDEMATAGAFYFDGSKMLSPRAATELSLCLPYAVACASQSRTVKIFDSDANGKSVTRLLNFGDTFVRLHNLKRSDVCLVLCMTANDHCFGAFVDEMWSKDEGWVGSRDSFLFSFTYDAVLPNHRRLDVPGAMYRGENNLQFGLTDLDLKADLNACTSEIEGSFGIGFRPRSTAAQKFLAGEQTFAIELLELWAIVPSEALD